jgi:hypothetical protein
MSAKTSPVKPGVSLLCKIGSILVHLDEGLSDHAHAFDWTALTELMADSEVQIWLMEMRELALVPEKRIR